MPPACGPRGCLQSHMSELVALRSVPDFSGTSLGAPLDCIAADLPQLGTAVAVTRNGAAVMTQIGSYDAPCFSGEALRPSCPPAGVAACRPTCLRLCRPMVRTTLAVDQMPASRLPCSLQFFDAEGSALHKSFLMDYGDAFAFRDLQDSWRPAGTDAAEGDAPEDAALLHDACPNDNCARQIDCVFGDYGLKRRAALPGWGRNWAWQVQHKPIFDLLALASEVRMPLLVTVGNAGAVQLYRGPLESVRAAGALTVLGAQGVTVSIEHGEIEEAWVTRIFHEGQPLLILELYDWRYHCVAMITAPALPLPGLGTYWEQLLLSLPRC